MFFAHLIGLLHAVCHWQRPFRSKTETILHAEREGPSLQGDGRRFFRRHFSKHLILFFQTLLSFLKSWLGLFFYFCTWYIFSKSKSKSKSNIQHQTSNSNNPNKSYNVFRPPYRIASRSVTLATTVSVKDRNHTSRRA